MEGLEPPTLGLEIRCSILLSYTPARHHHHTANEVAAHCPRGAWPVICRVWSCRRKMFAPRTLRQGFFERQCLNEGQIGCDLIVEAAFWGALAGNPRGDRDLRSRRNVSRL